MKGGYGCKKRGRKKALSESQIQEARELREKNHTIREIAEVFKVSRMCVWRALNAKRKRIVVKLGGKSLAKADLVKDAATAIAKEAKEKEIIVVVSAPGNTTSSLVEMLEGVSSKARPKEWDIVLSYGERISSSVLSIALKELGVKTICLDPSSEHWPIITNQEFGNAEPLEKEAKEICRKKLEPLLRQNYVIVMPGFVGKTLDNEISTMGRGASDLSAFFIAKCIGADEVIKISDVDGVYLNGQKVERISVEELTKICSNGTTHYEKPYSIIQLKALNYFNPNMTARVISHHAKSLEASGTVIYSGEKRA